MVIDRISKYVESKGIKQTSLADALNVSPQVMSNILSGKRKLTVEEYGTICKFLEVPYDRFMTPEPEPRESEVA